MPEVTPLSEPEFQQRIITSLEDQNKKIVSLRTETEEKLKRLDQIEEVKSIVDKTSEHIDELTKKVIDIRKRGLLEHRAPPRPGRVSEQCARHLGAIGLLAALRRNEAANGDRIGGIVRDILGIESRAALTTTDIPLPTEYASEVVELVSQYGSARQYGTVYPLGAGSVKLPRLKTSPAFGLIAMSGSVPEKSPQIEFVTFSASKWGGLVRLPSEIDEDSIVPMGQFIARYSAREIAKIEDTVFWTADGTATYDLLEGLTKAVDTASKVTTMGAGKTAFSDSTLTNWRALRTNVDTPALTRGAYYCHPSFEQHLAGFNTSGNKPYVANGVNGATLDGFPIRWVDVLPAYSTAASTSTVFALFGDPSFMYLGVRGGIRFDSSVDAGFATDEILIRALERFTIGYMATGAVGGLKTAAV